MEDQPTPMDPGNAKRRFAEMLEQAGLPRATRQSTSFSSPGITDSRIHIDLTRRDQEPIDDWERDTILGLEFDCGCASIHVTVHGSPQDPRLAASPPGVEIPRAPPLHPDDVMYN